MSSDIEIVAPKLMPSEVRVFIAEDSSYKRDDIIASLGAVGLDHTLTVVTSLEEAEEFVEAQKPHNLTANVFLLDGGLLPGASGAIWHGADLAARLHSKYLQPIKAIIDRTVRELEEVGLSKNEINKVLGSSHATYDLARRQLQSEALLVGVSSVEKGGIGYTAQYPWTPYQEVGLTVFNTVVPKAEKRRIEKEQLRAQQEANAEAVRAERAAKRAALAEQSLQS